MPRGRPKKNKESNNMFEKAVAKKARAKKKLNAIFVDVVDFVDTTTGIRESLNIYRITKNKSNKFEDDDEHIYVGFEESFIDNLEKGIIPTPLGAAEILDDIDEEDDSLDFDY